MNYRRQLEKKLGSLVKLNFYKNNIVRAVCESDGSMHFFVIKNNSIEELPDRPVLA